MAFVVCVVFALPSLCHVNCYATKWWNRRELGMQRFTFGNPTTEWKFIYRCRKTIEVTIIFIVFGVLAFPSKIFECYWFLDVGIVAVAAHHTLFQCYYSLEFVRIFIYICCDILICSAMVKYGIGKLLCSDAQMRLCTMLSLLFVSCLRSLQAVLYAL